MAKDKTHEDEPAHPHAAAHPHAHSLPPEKAGAPGGEEPKSPKHATPKLADVGELPRVCQQLDRAPEGCQRFKIRCTSQAEMPYVYILAKKDDETAAKDCYCKQFGLDGKKEKLTVRPLTD